MVEMPVSFRLHPSEKEGVFDRHRSHMNRSVLKDRLLEDDIREFSGCHNFGVQTKQSHRPFFGCKPPQCVNSTALKSEMKMKPPINKKG